MPLAYHEHGDQFRSNHPIAAALRDYSRAGRQVVVLTSNQNLAAQLERVGARTFQIHAQRVVHAHRPLWKPHYDAEHYVGPHPHTYGHRGADEVLGYDRHFVDVNSQVQTNVRRSQRAAQAVDVNRDFDMAWREAYGFYDNPDRARGPVNASEFTDFARDGIDHRDGYYFADTYTTVASAPPLRGDAEGRWTSHTSSNGAASNGAARTAAVGQPPGAAAPVPGIQAPASPFYLSVDSPIDQAPSIDAVAAARLRGLNVTHINHLMQQDSNRLADALGLANVDAATIRRWQAECRLVCRVPQLRGFDARVLVGCGITTPAQLASIHPVDLLQEVEEFLTTDRGQRILLSGSSHELSRITSWIAAANSSSDRDFAALGRGRDSRGRVIRADAPRQRRRSYYRGFNHDDESGYAFDSDGYEYQEGQDGTLGRRAEARRRRRIIRTMNQRDAASNAGDRARSLRNNGYFVEADGNHDDDSTGNGRGRSRRGSGAGNGSGRLGEWRREAAIRAAATAMVVDPEMVVLAVMAPATAVEPTPPGVMELQDVPADADHVAPSLKLTPQLAMSFDTKGNAPIENQETRVKVMNVNRVNTVSATPGNHVRISHMTQSENCVSTCIETAPLLTLRRSDHEWLKDSVTLASKR